MAIVGDISRMKQLAGTPYNPFEAIGPDNNHVYYNVKIDQLNADAPAPPTPSTPVPARFREERVQPLIDRMEDYYFSIVRFSIPTANLPIFFYFPDFTPPNSDPRFSNTYTITLGFNGLFVRQAVNYLESTSVTGAPPPLPPFGPTTVQDNQRFYTVNSYEQWLQAINTAFQVAYNNPIFALSPAFVAGEPAPYFKYDPVTQLITLVAGRLFNASPGNPGIQIYMNTNLYAFFNPSFQTNFNGYDLANGTDYQIFLNNNNPGQNLPPINYATRWSATINYNIGSIVFNPGDGNFYVSIATPNIGNNPPNPGFWLVSGAPFVNPPEWDSTTAYVAGAQVLYQGTIWEADAGSTGIPPGAIDPTTQLAPWHEDPAFLNFRTTQDFSTLFSWNIFKQIAFVTGILPTRYEYTPNNTLAGNQNFRAILTDFEPNQGEGPEIRSVLQYFPQGPYRMIALNGKGPLMKTDFQVYWVDDAQNFYPVLLGPFDVLSIKCLFRKKTYTGS